MVRLLRAVRVLNSDIVDFGVFNVHCGDVEGWTWGRRTIMEDREITKNNHLIMSQVRGNRTVLYCPVQDT